MLQRKFWVVPRLPGGGKDPNGKVAFALKVLPGEGFSDYFVDVKKRAIATRECGFPRLEIAENRQMAQFRQNLCQPLEWGDRVSDRQFNLNLRRYVYSNVIHIYKQASCMDMHKCRTESAKASSINSTNESVKLSGAENS
jgi:hypothetical protein